MTAARPARSHRKARLVLGGLTLVLGTGAVVGVRALRRAQPPAGRPVPAADRPVLLMNPRSGAGKAERFGLQRECRARGIEPVVLEPGQDLVALAEAAVAGGADVLGMAGGDGSQALLADVAARHGLAMVVVPAGTRNHLAMDLGLDRDDVVGALDAFGAAVEHPIDLGDVNGKPFVNNVSLGLYAEIVRLPEYRDAKLETTLNTLPGLLGPGRPPFDLRFTGPAGEQHTGAHVVQVSNNPYGRTIGTFLSRPRLDSGHLGVIALELPDDPADKTFLAAVAAGRPEHFPGYVAWTPSTFEVTSDALINAGIDGEALQIAPPLRFTSRPAALHIRLPRHASGLSPAARELRARSTVRGLRYPAAGLTAGLDRKT
ncbi:diacylglycerol kinase [Pseudonocardia kujensis]|uniref:diacylglycerol/lipid kinase family protein n=1 Tax=Pseudonocardia kujensis TaxID=1128675 RepID=UPI001E510B72|nr:diacylglycerol kinase family protein [Pseudonocardia kujensis]MCE0768231.1 diacylglycerol kinase [Pseudonocardia kujensis]